MKAAVLYELHQPVVVQDIDMEGPKEGEVLVKMAATGVCHSCYHAVTGVLGVPLPSVLGDEGAGVVEEVGKGVALVNPGDHVILSWVPSCGHCIYCAQGRPQSLPDCKKENKWIPSRWYNPLQEKRQIHSSFCHGGFFCRVQRDA